MIYYTFNSQSSKLVFVVLCFALVLSFDLGEPKLGYFYSLFCLW